MNSEKTRLECAETADNSGAPARPRVLVAEDCPDSRQAVCSFLSRAGFDVIPAENGRVAISLASENKYDLILLDMQMPEIDGYEAARRLRAGGFCGPVIALTGDVEPGDEEACHDAGCDSYLAKPWEPEQLIRELQKHIKFARPNPKENQPRTTTRAEPTLPELGREFMRGLPGTLSDMTAALSARDRPQVARLAHRTAGAAGLFGYSEICKTARRIEAVASDSVQSDSTVGEQIRHLAALTRTSEQGSAE